MRKAILVGVCLDNTHDFNENMEEMVNLAQACEIEIIQTITQTLRSPHKQTYINSGKLEEVQAMINEDVDLVLLDREVAPSQLKNLEKALEIEVIDKTNLILQIFALRAQTKEAKMQVEVARLKYTLPRLRGTYDKLDKQKGGNKNKGTGEKKIELDTRNISSQIHALEKEIKEIGKQRNTQRRQRYKTGIKTVAIVGYTNAGKSSIMNGFMDKEEKEDKKVFEKDMLFATLTTSTRKITLDNKKEFLLSDTVGFVSDLPHNLVKAFHSTLEEVVHADILLQVIDISNPYHQTHIDVTLKTLESIKASHIPIFYIFNKCDKTSTPYPTSKDNHIYICAKEDTSIQMLVDTICDSLFQLQEKTFLLPYDQGSILSYINEKTQVTSQMYEEDGVKITCECDDELYEKLKSFEADQ